MAVLISHPSPVTSAADGVPCLVVLITVSSSPYGIGYDMLHKLTNITIEKDSITVTAIEQVNLNAGDTLTLVFNGDIVPMKRAEWDALIAYRDWRSVDDPRGESQEAGVVLPTPSNRALVHNAGAEWLRRIHLGLHRLLQRAIFRD